MCAHVWAQQNQAHGRSTNMRFDGPVLYSYATPIAHITRDAYGQSVALFSSKTYSPSTARQISIARGAWSGNAFTVPDLLLSPGSRGRYRGADTLTTAHAVNLEYLTTQYNKERDALVRCPAGSWRLSVDHVSDTLRNSSHRQLLYANAFKLAILAGSSHDLQWMADRDVVLARRDGLLADPKRVAKAEKAKAARDARQARYEELHRAEASVRIAAWLAGETVELRYKDVPHDGGQLLRIKGNQIETSAGAVCPMADAVAALQFWRYCVDRNAPYDKAHDSRVRKLGHFTLDRIDTDGAVHAGCHKFTRATLEALERSLAGA
jgi:hypothetical protein